jgi:hypothetical protein
MLRARSGVNPIEARRVEKAAAQAEQEAKELTFSKLANLFIKEYAETKQKPATVGETCRLLNRANAFWADRPVRDISKGDVLILLDEIAATRQRKRAHGTSRPLREATAGLPHHFVSMGCCRGQDRKPTRWMASARIASANPSHASACSSLTK